MTERPARCGGSEGPQVEHGVPLGVRKASEQAEHECSVLLVLGACTPHDGIEGCLEAVFGGLCGERLLLTMILGLLTYGARKGSRKDVAMAVSREDVLICDPKCKLLDYVSN